MTSQSLTNGNGPGTYSTKNSKIKIILIYFIFIRAAKIILIHRFLVGQLIPRVSWSTPHIQQTTLFEAECDNRQVRYEKACKFFC